MYPPPKQRHVLLAEDDPTLRRLMASQLRAAGFEVTESRNGGELIDCIARTVADPIAHSKPDLIVTDVWMPIMSGLDALYGLRRARFDVPVVVLTAFGSPGIQARALALGARLVLEKPFDLDELVDHALRLTTLSPSSTSRPPSFAAPHAGDMK